MFGNVQFLAPNALYSESIFEKDYSTIGSQAVSLPGVGMLLTHVQGRPTQRTYKSMAGLVLAWISPVPSLEVIFSERKTRLKDCSSQA